MRIDENPGYLAAIERIALMLRNARRAGLDCRFRLPPKEAMVIAPLEALLPRLALNDDALTVGKAICLSLDDEGGASVFMLCIALEHAGYECPRVGLGELGLVAGRA